MNQLYVVCKKHNLVPNTSRLEVKAEKKTFHAASEQKGGAVLILSKNELSV
jgi:hypothetical protein